MKSSENLVWIDCEMTGLDVEKDCLVEIAVLVTDSELNILDDGLSVVIKPREDSLAGMGEFVTNMHKESGLL
jgi:oligoribonuclease